MTGKSPEHKIMLPRKLVLKALAKSLTLDCVLHYRLLQGNIIAWTIRWPMHLIIIMVLIGHLEPLGFLPTSTLAYFLGLPEAFIVETIPLFLGLTLLIIVSLLIIHELLSSSIRLMLTLNGYIFLVLLFLAVLSGNMLRLSAHLPEALTLSLFGLFPYTLKRTPSLTWLIIHSIASQLFLMTLPFTKLLHVITQPIVAFTSRLEEVKRYKR
jgi:nitrate reductase gamma subunit